MRRNGYQEFRPVGGPYYHLRGLKLDACDLVRKGGFPHQRGVYSIAATPFVLKALVSYPNATTYDKDKCSLPGNRINDMSVVNAT